MELAIGSGGSLMPAYRLYSFDGDLLHIHDAEWIVAETDEDAVAEAHARRKPVRCELWQGTRLVAEIPAVKEY